MNFWQTIGIKISTAITSILIMVGIVQAPVPMPKQPEIIKPAQTADVLIETPNIKVYAPIINGKQTTKDDWKVSPKQEVTNNAESANIAVPTPVVVEQQPIQVPEQSPPVLVMPIYINQPETTSAPEPEKVINKIPMEKQLEIISPIAGKGLGRTYTAREQIKDEENYIEICLIVRDEQGNETKEAEVVVMATDEKQNKTMKGTGNVARLYENGVKKVVPCYPYHYEFKTPGEHVIVFTTNGLTESVTLNATKDERPE